MTTRAERESDRERERARANHVNRALVVGRQHFNALTFR